MKRNNNPIVFIPGLMGSMGEDIIEGTGEWSFGVASWIYDPLIDKLSEIGYERGENLYVCYYDWRRESAYTIEHYLWPLLEEVRRKHPNKKIDFITHSMGGIIARSYIQMWNFQQDIDKFIMIGSPNKGALEAYYLWSTGKMIPTKNKGNLYHLLSRGYIWLLQRLLNFSFGVEHLEEIHATFPSIEELLPTWDYGDILCYEEAGMGWQTIPQYYLKYRNHFLNELNETVSFIPYKINEMYCITGYSHSTPQYLMVDKEKLFEEGEEIIIDTVETLDGDGTVLVKSSEIQDMENLYIKANHREIVKESYAYIKQIYGYEDAGIKDKEEMEEKSAHLLFWGMPSIVMVYEDKIVMSFIDGNIQTPYDYIYEKFSKEYKWLALKDLPSGKYTIIVDNTSNEDIDMMMLTENMKEETTLENIKAHQENYTFYFEIM